MLHLPISEFFLALAMMAGLVMYAFYYGCDPLERGVVAKGDQVSDVCSTSASIMTALLNFYCMYMCLHSLIQTSFGGGERVGLVRADWQGSTFCDRLSFYYVYWFFPPR